MGMTNLKKANHCLVIDKISGKVTNPTKIAGN